MSRSVVPRTVCLDMDGVLTDFMAASHKFHGLEYDYDKYPYELGDWDTLPPSTATMTGRMFWDSLDEDFWADMPPMPGARELLTILEETFGKDNIYLLTAPTLSPQCLSGKVRWIQRYMPEYDRRYLIGPSKGLCANPHTLLIDDADHNVKSFRAMGGQAILIPRKWNALHKYADKPLAIFTRSLQHIMKGNV